MSKGTSCNLSPELEDEVEEAFKRMDVDGSGYIEQSELQETLKGLNLHIPAYQLREIVGKFDTQTQDGKLSFVEFKQMFTDLHTQKNAFGAMFKQSVKTNRTIETKGGTSSASVEGTTHSVKSDELVSFSDWINTKLKDDEDCKTYLPLQDSELYAKVGDGIILCKLINESIPDTIDERAINKTNLNVYRKTENLNLALNSAQSIGCQIVNIGHVDIQEKKEHLILGLLWQVIRIGLVSDINLHNHPGLALLLEGDEDKDVLKSLSPEQILIRWVNYHLNRAGSNRKIQNFSADIKDSEVYSILLEQIAPPEAGVNSSVPLSVSDSNLEQRAELMLQEADKMGCRSFVSPKDVVGGNTKLNMAFVANLFNTYPALDTVEREETEDNKEETREEKTYRNWMNSLVTKRYVHYLYSDLKDCIVIFELYDIIRKGCVDWGRVKIKFNPMRKSFELIENCNYAIDLGKEMKFSLVGICGNDIRDGNETLTLALLWQLMRAYTLSILNQLTGQEKDSTKARKKADEELILNWAKTKLKEGGKTSTLSSFHDPSLSDSKTILELIDCIKPRTVNFELLTAGSSDEEKYSNAKYAVSMARKIGAKVYALPEDICDVKPKMIMTIFACLMIKDLGPQGQQKGSEES